MKLFVWHPSGHGQYTFSVVAESEERAFQIIDAHIKANHMDNTWPGDTSYVADGWGTDYYKLQVFEIEQVFEHDND
jgi:hypothetical protein